MLCGMPRGGGAALVARRAQVVVVADETLEASSPEVSLQTSVAAHTYNRQGEKVRQECKNGWTDSFM